MKYQIDLKVKKAKGAESDAILSFLVEKYPKLRFSEGKVTKVQKDTTFSPKTTRVEILYNKTNAHIAFVTADLDFSKLEDIASNHSDLTFSMTAEPQQTGLVAAKADGVSFKSKDMSDPSEMAVVKGLDKVSLISSQYGIATVKVNKDKYQLATDDLSLVAADAEIGKTPKKAAKKRPAAKKKASKKKASKKKA